MYVGNNKFVHSPSPGKTVRYESLSTSYYVKGYVTARRIIDWLININSYNENFIFVIAFFNCYYFEY